MRTPSIVINFKSYPHVNGKKGLDLARACDEVAAETSASIIICPQMVDLALTVREVDIPVWSQSADPVEPGSQTGWCTMEAIKGTGAAGTLVNHSEHRMKLADMDAVVRKAEQAGLETIVCTNNVSVSKAAAALKPDFVAVEPPELIGGDISVTSADPDIVSDSVEAVKKIDANVKVLCGAGVKNGRDVAKAIELGAHGVLLASGVVKSADPKAVLVDLVSGI